jgi:hypothetical protein
VVTGLRDRAPSRFVSVGTVTDADIQAFAARDWRLIEQAKLDGWREQKAARTPSAALKLGAELYQYARTLRPDWPSASERDADLAPHIRVARMLQSAGQDRPR